MKINCVVQKIYQSCLVISNHTLSWIGGPKRLTKLYHVTRLVGRVPDDGGELSWKSLMRSKLRSFSLVEGKLQLAGTLIVNNHTKFEMIHSVDLCVKEKMFSCTSTAFVIVSIGVCSNKYDSISLCLL